MFPPPNLVTLQETMEMEEEQPGAENEAVGAGVGGWCLLACVLGWGAGACVGVAVLAYREVVEFVTVWQVGLGCRICTMHTTGVLQRNLHGCSHREGKHQ